MLFQEEAEHLTKDFTSSEAGQSSKQRGGQKSILEMSSFLSIFSSPNTN
jgi:hypothetical protein